MNPDPVHAGVVAALVDANYHDRAYRESIKTGRGILIAFVAGAITIALIVGGTVLGMWLS